MHVSATTDYTWIGDLGGHGRVRRSYSVHCLLLLIRPVPFRAALDDLDVQLTFHVVLLHSI